MMSHGTVLSKEETAECRKLIEGFRKTYSWNSLGRMLGVAKMKHFRDGHGSTGQVLKDFLGAPTLELYMACQQLQNKLERKEHKVQQENRRINRVPVYTDEEETDIRLEILRRIKASPGISRGQLAKLISGNTTLVRKIIYDMLHEGAIVDKYKLTARRSELRLNSNGFTPHVEVKPEEHQNTEPVPAEDPDEPPEILDELPTVRSTSWDSIRAKLLSAADDIKQMGNELSLSTGLPLAMRRDMTEIFIRRHDKLLKFIEEELE